MIDTSIFKCEHGSLFNAFIFVMIKNVNVFFYLPDYEIPYHSRLIVENFLSDEVQMVCIMYMSKERYYIAMIPKLSFDAYSMPQQMILSRDQGAVQTLKEKSAYNGNIFPKLHFMLGSHPKRKLPKRSYWNRSYQTLKI